MLSKTVTWLISSNIVSGSKILTCQNLDFSWGSVGILEVAFVPSGVNGSSNLNANYFITRSS